MYRNVYQHPKAGQFVGRPHDKRETAQLAADVELAMEPETRLVGRLRITSKIEAR